MCRCFAVIAITLCAISITDGQGIQTAQDKAVLNQILTYGFYNGRSWNSCTNDEKVEYIIGFAEGLSEAPPSVAAQYDFGGLTGAEVRDAINRFYADPENILIQIRDALRVFAMKVKGVPQSQIEVRISALRKNATQAPERK